MQGYFSQASTGIWGEITKVKNCWLEPFYREKKIKKKKEVTRVQCVLIPILCIQLKFYPPLGHGKIADSPRGAEGAGGGGGECRQLRQLLFV